MTLYSALIQLFQIYSSKLSPPNLAINLSLLSYKSFKCKGFRITIREEVDWGEFRLFDIIRTYQWNVYIKSNKVWNLLIDHVPWLVLKMSALSAMFQRERIETTKMNYRSRKKKKSWCKFSFAMIWMKRTVRIYNSFWKSLPSNPCFLLWYAVQELFSAKLTH